MTRVKQDILHGGTNNDTFDDKTLTYYDDEDKAVKSVEGTEVTKDEDDNPVLHIDKGDIDDLKVNIKALIQELEVNGDTVLNGNLTVKGTHTEEHSQDLFVGSDTITLRDGAQTALDNGEYSGLIINKIDGTNALGLVTTSNGTLRVGYLNLVYVYTTTDDTSEKFGHYYKEATLETEVIIPTGKTVFIESTDTEKKLAKGYYIHKDETQTIATRDDSGDIKDKDILYFDKAQYKLVDANVDYRDLINLVATASKLVGDDKIIISENEVLSDIDFEGNGDEAWEWLVAHMGYFDGALVTDDWVPSKYSDFEVNDVKIVSIHMNYGNIRFLDENGITHTVGLSDTVAFSGTLYPVHTKVSLKDDNKIYTYSDIAVMEDDIANGLIPDGATVHLLNDLNTESIAVSDTVERGNYNVVTSDALWRFLNTYSENIPGTFTLNGWTLSYGV